MSDKEKLMLRAFAEKEMEQQIEEEQRRKKEMLRQKNNSIRSKR